MVEYNVITFVCQLYCFPCLNRLVKNFVHAVYVCFRRDYRSKILQCAFKRGI